MFLFTHSNYIFQHSLLEGFKFVFFGLLYDPGFASMQCEVKYKRLVEIDFGLDFHF